MSDDLFERTSATFTGRLQADLGIKGFHADGFFGNIGVECNGFRNLQEISPLAGTGGYGWASWTGPRRLAFLRFCTEHHLDPRLPETNYQYLVHDMIENYPHVLDMLRMTTTRDGALDVILDHYEMPGIPHRDARVAYAKRAEAARVLAESAIAKPSVGTATSVPPAAQVSKEEKTMNDVTAAVTGTVIPPDNMTDALHAIETKVLAFAQAQLVAHGVPSSFAAMAVGLIDKLDLPQKAEDALRKIDIENMVVAATNALLHKKAA